MLPFSYEDRFPDTQTRHGYVATNEEPPLMRRLIKPFKRGLAICSAGEVTYLALLPKTRESLVLIDHSYNSLRVFCIKSLLLATLGPMALRNLLIDEDHKKWREAAEKVCEHLPVSLNNTRVLGDLTGEPANVRREWYYADLPSLKRATAALHKIKLVHGDLLDTQDRAPYDFLYLSNALEHQCRPQVPPVPAPAPKPLRANYPYSPPYTYPNAEVLGAKLLKPGSKILWVQANGTNTGGNPSANTLWPPKLKLKGYRTTWVYNLSAQP